MQLDLVQFQVNDFFDFFGNLGQERIGSDFKCGMISFLLGYFMFGNFLVFV